MNYTCGFIGLGLIGGSIAKALKEQNPLVRILAYDIDPDALALARADQVADICFPVLNEDAAMQLGSCDILFLCAPVGKNNDTIRVVKKYLNPDCILTDVGSVKTTIHRAIEQEGLGDSFIGGHPMAGSEKTGYQHANPQLFENAFYFLTPSESVSDKKVEFLKELVTLIGAIPLVIDCEKHDSVTAAVSHLPHVIAYCLVNLVREKDDDGLMKLIAAGGFRDITRIASSSPLMWQQICMTNTYHIDRLLEDYITLLDKMRQNIRENDTQALFDFFQTAKDYRDSMILTSTNAVGAVHEIYMDIPDKTGAIALTATTLALNNISIKNIGIMHNREFQEGVLHIEFYDAASKERAVSLLKQNNCTIYE